MLFVFRFSKYRKDGYAGGAYQLDEWTHFGDIGKTFAGVPFDWGNYVAEEDRYVDFLREVCRIAGGNNLYPVLEERGSPLQTFPDQLTLSDAGFSIGHDADHQAVHLLPPQQMNLHQALAFSRLCLRGALGTAITNERDLVILFLDNFYVEIVCPLSAYVELLPLARGLNLQELGFLGGGMDEADYEHLFRRSANPIAV